jgi:hypothetical protein
MLIVCEGTQTEPQYLRWIVEQHSIPKEIWSTVEIRDTVSLPDDIALPKPTELGGKRARRKLKSENPNRKKQTERNVLKELLSIRYGQIEGLKIYTDVKAVPLRYVALAQEYDDYYGDIYDELWAVFDKDGHTHHEEAYKLAQKTNDRKQVNIALSCRSFEQWILLHFEKSKHAFEQTACKGENEIGKEVVLNCNDKNGCKGNTCLVGYIRKKHFSDYAKSNKTQSLHEMMTLLLEKIEDAFENSVWLREQIQDEIKAKEGKLYLVNSYTDVDILVKKLLGL